MDFSDEMMDEIFDIFQVESEEIISKINNNLLLLDKNPQNKDAILMLFRDAHSLKGAARMVGLNDVQSMAHKIEDVLGLAKENKFVFNSKVISILLKSVDFLAELINKSIAKKQQIYSEDFSKQMALLENITELGDMPVKYSEQKISDKDFLMSHINKINQNIINSLTLLMKIESDNDENDINRLLSITVDLYNLFKEMGSFDIKKHVEDIKVKLEFTMNASKTLTFEETTELHKIFDEIITEITCVCELYNIEIVDYYSAIFEQSENVEMKDILPQNIETPIFEIKDSVEKTQDEIINTPENLGVTDIIDKMKAFLVNNCSVTEVRDLIINYQKSCENTDVNKIFDKIVQIFDFSIKNETKLNDEMLSVIMQNIEHCDNLIKNKKEHNDDELLFQRLTIMHQLLDFEKQNDSKSQILPANEKLKKFSDNSKVFDTGEITTLRVDSIKLDELVNRINELSLEKIKSKKHLLELELIGKDLDDWQKNFVRVLNFLKYHDKKATHENINDKSTIFIKQLLNLFTGGAKDLQKIGFNIDALQRMVQEDDIKMDLTIENIEGMVKNIRILPLATVFHLFGRMVRDIAEEKGKKINLEILGSETTADKKIIEEIKTPLIHIIRNSIDHGIETPEERIALGKPAEGKIVLSAYGLNNKVIIEIKDDGSGINIEKIKEKAVSKGFLTPEEVNSMTDEQLTGLIFTPGFSTGDTITNISGRGIGLDVVQSKIAQLNGKIKVLSELHKGCCLQIELPTSMSLLKVFVVKISNQIFAIPIDTINTVLRKTEDEIIYKKNKKSIIFENEAIDLYDLADILGLEKNISPKNKITILILENDNKKTGICVDKLVGEQEVLHKKLAAPFYKLKNISGLTTLISGEVCMILNVSDILNFKEKNPINHSMLKPKKFKDNKNFNILLVDDSPTTRTLEKNILKKIGYSVETAENPIIALEIMNDKHFDLIISDIEMPEMNGFDFVKKIKTDEMYADIPVIMVSSLFDDEIKTRAMRAGALKYIVKGAFNQQDFQDAIDDILNKKN